MIVKRVDKSGGRRGASTVEFAFVAPVLFMFVFGMIWWGRVMMVQELLANAAREGARAASLPDSSNPTDRVTDVIRDYLENTGVDPGRSLADITFTGLAANTAKDQQVTVAVSIMANEISWLPMPSGN